MELVDTHCHLDLQAFDTDLPAVIGNAQTAGVSHILNPAINLESSRRIVALTKLYPVVYGALGVHPGDALSWGAETLADLRSLFSMPENQAKVVAVGEIGLDYYWDGAPHSVQIEVLEQQLGLAAELRKPVILHMREHADAQDGECSRDMLAILARWVGWLKQSGNPLANAPGVLHSFSGSIKIAEEAVGMNFFIGVTGPITFKSAEAKRQVVKSLPMERLLIETDAPFLAPLPHRGRRNEPSYVALISDKIASIHNKDPEETAAVVCQNADRLFSWGG